MIVQKVQWNGNFWIGSVEEIERYLKVVERVREVLLEDGFQDTRASVGGGVHELDTGHEAFGARYAAFPEMREKLAGDFTKAEEKLDGLWLNKLNFGCIWLDMAKDGETVSVEYQRGRVTIAFSDERTEERLCERCVRACSLDAAEPEAANNE